MDSKKKESQWWEKSILLVEGCSPVSAGCKHCWSAAMTKRFHGAKGLTNNVGQFNGKIICREDRLHELMRKKPTVWTIWNDLFWGEKDGLGKMKEIPIEFVKQCIEVMRKCPQHTFLCLTKRIRRAKRMLESIKLPSNLVLGVTTENQEMADKRIPILLQIPAPVRFVSIEPVLSLIDLNRHFWSPVIETSEYVGEIVEYEPRQRPDWAIIGCESGPKRRECKLEWVRSIVEQCRQADVPVFVKQIPINGKVSHDMNKWPEDLRLRQFPEFNQLKAGGETT